MLTYLELEELCAKQREALGSQGRRLRRLEVAFLAVFRHYGILRAREAEEARRLRARHANTEDHNDDD